MQTSDLEDLCAVAGYRATRYLSVWFAGRNLYVPQSAGPGHPLARLIGGPALTALVREFPCEFFSVPGPAADLRLYQDREIAERLCAGEAPKDIGHALGISTRRVEQIREELHERGWIDWAAAGRRRGLGTGVRDLILAP